MPFDPKEEGYAAAFAKWDLDNAKVLTWFHNSVELTLIRVSQSMRRLGKFGSTCGVCTFSPTLQSGMNLRCLFGMPHRRISLFRDFIMR